MTTHLGRRVSDLLDGQLPAAEADAAWAHVHTCHLCRDAVEREGWVKTRLSTLSQERGCAPDHLKGALLGMPPGDVLLAMSQGCSPQRDLVNRSRGRRAVGMAALGGGAVGAAVVGVLALGTAPADAPTIDRRQPPVSQVSPSQTPPRLPSVRLVP